MNWIDCGIIAVLGIGIYYGIRRGFLESVLGLVGAIVAIGASKWFYKGFAVFLIENTTIEKGVQKFLFGKSLTGAMEHPVANIPGVQSQITDMQSFITTAAIQVIALLCIYAAARVILFTAQIILRDLGKLPVFRELNGMGGAVLGLLRSGVILLIVFAFIVPLSAVGPWADLGDSIKASVLAKYFYNYNFILGWVWDTATDLVRK